MGLRMGSVENDVNVVLSGYERWNRDDLTGLSELFSEDVVFQAPAGWPGPRIYYGVTAVTSFLENEVARVIALRPVKVVRAEPVGTEILIELRARTLGSRSGIEIEDLTVFHVARVEDGKVTRVRAYVNEEAATRAASTGED